VVVAVFELVARDVCVTEVLRLKNDPVEEVGLVLGLGKFMFGTDIRGADVVIVDVTEATLGTELRAVGLTPGAVIVARAAVVVVVVVE
jgi:hypothetical protein